MSDEVRLRDVEQSDLRAFFEQEQDPEALRRSQFTPRDWERFVAHWNKEILEDETVHVQAISIDGTPPETKLRFACLRSSGSARPGQCGTVRTSTSCSS